METVQESARVVRGQKVVATTRWLKVAVLAVLVLVVAGCNPSPSNGTDSTADGPRPESTAEALPEPGAAEEIGDDEKAGDTDSAEQVVENDPSVETGESESTEDAAETDSAELAAENDSARQTDEAAGTTVDLEELVYESPISDALGLSNVPDARSQAIRDSETREREAAVAACMAAEGFEYIPRPLDVPDGPVRQPAEPIDRDSREFAETYGFGFTTLTFPQRRLAPGVAGYDEVTFDAALNAVNEANQNLLIRQQMSDSEGTAYDRALFGIEVSDGEQPAEDERGCAKSSFGERSSEDELYGLFSAEFEEDIADLFDRVRADPRLLVERQAADECIQSAGHQALEQPWQIQELFQPRVGDLGRRDQLTNEPTSADSVPTEFHSRYESPLSDDLMEELRELQSEEITMATAYVDCGRPGSRLPDEFFEAFDIVRIELETQFVAENQDRIALLLAELGE